VADESRLVVLGTRGSIGVSGSGFARYGGNTTSFALVVGDEAVAFIDAGTGLLAHRAHGLSLAPSVHIFLTHYHWDHIQGLTMFDAIWAEDREVVIHGPGAVERSLTSVIAPPWFPVSLDEARAVRYETVSRAVEIAGMLIVPFAAEHPQGALGYRVDGPSASLAIVTDHEAGTGRDASIVESIRGVDVLVHDAQYRPDEVEMRRGWGHSTWVDAVAAAESAGVRRLLLTSLDPRSTDADVDRILDAVRERFPHSDVAYPGVEVRL
jgi:ribonuclease BN (tRNA processing enzyme)